jgi:spore maturation protein CgeB
MKKIIEIAVITDKLNSQGQETNGYKIYLSLAMYSPAIVSLYGHEGEFDSVISKADIILMLGTVIYDRNLYQIEELSKLKKPGAKLILWYFDACNPEFSHCKHKYEKIKSILPYLDWLFTTDHSYPWENDIENYYHLSQGIYYRDFEEEPQKREKEFDVIFTGGLKGLFSYRQELIDAIKEAGYSVDIYGSGRDSERRIYENEFREAYEKAKIALVPQSHGIVNNKYWSNRIYLATATGTPCIVGYTPGIEKHFIPGEGILLYQNKSELLKKIKYLIDNPDRARSIGMTGRRTTIKCHTYRERIKEMLQVISETGVK